jgi:hypothetical protein
MQDLKVLHRAVLEGNAKTAKQTTEQDLATRQPWLLALSHSNWFRTI